MRSCILRHPLLCVLLVGPFFAIVAPKDVDDDQLSCYGPYYQCARPGEAPPENSAEGGSGVGGTGVAGQPPPPTRNPDVNPLRCAYCQGVFPYLDPAHSKPYSGAIKPCLGTGSEKMKRCKGSDDVCVRVELSTTIDIFSTLYDYKHWADSTTFYAVVLKDCVDQDLKDEDLRERKEISQFIDNTTKAWLDAGATIVDEPRLARQLFLMHRCDRDFCNSDDDRHWLPKPETEKLDLPASSSSPVSEMSTVIPRGTGIPVIKEPTQ